MSAVHGLSLIGFSGSDQQLFLLTRHRLDRQFTFQSETSTGLRLSVDQFDGEAAACLARSSPGVVLVASTWQIVGDPGVERVVGTPQNVDEPFRHFLNDQPFGVGFRFLAIRYFGA